MGGAVCERPRRSAVEELVLHEPVRVPLERHEAVALLLTGVSCRAG